MTVGGAFLGGSPGNDIPVGQCEIIVQILTDDRIGMARTVAIANGSHSYTVTTGADGNGSVLVATDGGNYTVTIQGITGYLNASPQIVTAMSTEAVLVRFDLMRLSSIALAMYPVGSLFISVNSANPSTYLGGTWEAFAQGRTLLGVSNEHPIGQSGGSETVTLNANQMPSHSHATTPHSHTGSYVVGAGEHDHRLEIHEIRAGFWQDEGNPLVPGLDGGVNPKTIRSGSHGHSLVIASESVSIGFSGGDQPHDNMMPYITTYIWKRTA